MQSRRSSFTPTGRSHDPSVRTMQNGNPTHRMVPERIGGRYQERRRKPQGPLKILRARVASAEPNTPSPAVSAPGAKACPASGLHAVSQAGKGP